MNDAANNLSHQDRQIIKSYGLPYLGSIDIMSLPCTATLITTLEISFENRNFLLSTSNHGIVHGTICQSLNRA